MNWYQKISDTLNGDGIPFSEEAPLWNKHKVKRLLENPRYTGADGYPTIIEREVFDTIQSMIRGKTANRTILEQMAALRQDEKQRTLRESRRQEKDKWLEQQEMKFTEYDDIITRRFVEKITVVDAETILVKIRDTDVEIEQSLC